MADPLVQKVITAYVDINGLTSDECKSLGLEQKQTDALCAAFADGFISEDERGKFTSVGFSSQFISDIAGVDGGNALRQRIKWLVETGLNDPDEYVRFRAALALGKTGPKAMDVVPALIAALKDQSKQVRSEAARALGEFGPKAKDAVPALIEAIKDQDEDEDVRSEAARAFVEIGPEAKDAVPALIEALKDDQGVYVRSNAAWALGAIGSDAKDAVPALIAALNKDPQWCVRSRAAEALGKIGPEAKDAVPSLVAALKDPYPDVRSNAAEAIPKIDSAITKEIPEDFFVHHFLCHDDSSKLCSEERKDIDMSFGENSIGARGLLLLREKFGIERFNRYHPTILEHLVKMATDPNHDRQKPLILALVASYDNSNIFYWGKHFEYDPRIRVLVIEAKTRDEFKKRAWEMRDTYGIPDVVFITAHGRWNQIVLGDGKWLTNGEIAEDFKGFFGKKKGQVVINACNAGAPPPKGKKNFAQMTANGFNAETIAARAVEGLMDLQVEIADDGSARLVPTYFELGAEFFGVNHGGMTFYPDQKPVYERVSDVNDSWQPGAALSVGDDEWRVGAGFGYSHQLFNRLRFRYDFLTDVSLTDAGSNNFISPRIIFNPEIAVGLSNHLMFATGAMGGVEFELDESNKPIVQPVIQQYSALKLVMPTANTEFDLGLMNTVDIDNVDTDNVVRPSFFSRLQGRFDILETP